MDKSNRPIRGDVPHILPAAILLWISLSACSLSIDRVAVVVSAPQVPPHWHAAWGNPVFDLEWWSPGGREEAGEPLAPGASIVVEVPRVIPVAFLATPRWPGAGAPGVGSLETLFDGPAPAGAVWPTERSDDGSIELSFHSAVVASLFAGAMRAGADVRDANVARLLHEFRTRLPDDPWMVDYLPLRAGLVARSLRATLIRAADRYEVLTPVPDGVWIGASPFAGPHDPSTGWPDLAIGLTVFWSTDGRRVVVSVDADGRSWATPPH